MSEDMIGIDFEQLVCSINKSTELSGSILDHIQVDEIKSSRGFYTAKADIVDGVINLSFKLPRRTSRRYKIANQRQLDKLLQVFYIRYFLYRQMVDVDLFLLTAAYVERVKQRNASYGEETRSVYLPNGEFVVNFKDAPWQYTWCFDEKPVLSLVVNTTMSHVRNIPSVIEAVASMCRYLASTIETDEEETQVVDLFNRCIIKGTPFILNEEWYNVEI